MLQPDTYLETDSAAGACLYKHGRPLSGISSTFLAMGLIFFVMCNARCRTDNFMILSDIEAFSYV